jgi:hypothetical protein
VTCRSKPHIPYYNKSLEVLTKYICWEFKYLTPAHSIGRICEERIRFAMRGYGLRLGCSIGRDTPRHHAVLPGRERGFGDPAHRCPRTAQTWPRPNVDGCTASAPARRWVERWAPAPLSRREGKSRSAGAPFPKAVGGVVRRLGERLLPGHQLGKQAPGGGPQSEAVMGLAKANHKPRCRSPLPITGTMPGRQGRRPIHGSGSSRTPLKAGCFFETDRSVLRWGMRGMGDGGSTGIF